jgi:hypothetical protein
LTESLSVEFADYPYDVLVEEPSVATSDGLFRRAKNLGQSTKGHPRIEKEGVDDSAI